MEFDVPEAHGEKNVQKKYRTFLVNNMPRSSVLKGVRKFCTCFLWYFLQSLMGTTENMYRERLYSLRTGISVHFLY